MKHLIHWSQRQEITNLSCVSLWETLWETWSSDEPFWGAAVAPYWKSQHCFFNMPSWMSADFPILNSMTCPNLSQECKVHTKNTHFWSSKGEIFFGEGLLGKVPQKKPGQAWFFFSLKLHSYIRLTLSGKISFPGQLHTVATLTSKLYILNIERKKTNIPQNDLSGNMRCVNGVLNCTNKSTIKLFQI